MSIPSAAFAVSCPVLHASPPGAAEQAYLHADYDTAATLYRKSLEEHPADPAASAALSRVLLRQQKVQEAFAVLAAAASAHPHNALLEASRAAVELRAGRPWDAADTDTAALRDDPCTPQAHRVAARLQELNSNYASQKREIETAHQLSPDDPGIRQEWILTLPLDQRIAELQAYLATPNGAGAEDRAETQTYLDRLLLAKDHPLKRCHLASPVAQAEIPFLSLMQDATHVRGYGLDVKVNDRSAHLQIDTGAGGIYVSSAIARSAHLQTYTRSKVDGIGDRGPQEGYLALVDSIRIGGLEFRDCLVEVSDRRSVVDTDGLIGMDVLSSFLVELDYPARKLILSPLPPRPGDEQTTPSLSTDPAADSSHSADRAATSGAASPSAPPARPTVSPRHDRYVAPTMKDYVPFYRDGHYILLPTSINGKTQRLFLLDTGASTTIVSPDAAREVTKVYQDGSITFHGVSGKVDKSFVAQSAVLQFANIRQAFDGIYGLDTSRISKSAGMEVSGMLGLSTLRQLTIHIDYRDGLVKFEYDKRRVPQQ